jgi:hypothetical protein
MSAEGCRDTGDTDVVWAELGAVRAGMARLIEARRLRGLSPAERARYHTLGEREAELLLRLR